MRSVRDLQALGHTVRLMPAYVKPYVGSPERSRHDLLS
jgi:hypothetical protein